MYKKYHLKAKKTRKQNDKKKGGSKKPSKKSKKTRKNIKGGAKKQEVFVNIEKSSTLPGVKGTRIVLTHDSSMWTCTDCKDDIKIRKRAKYANGKKLIDNQSGLKVCECKVTD